MASSVSSPVASRPSVLPFRTPPSAGRAIADLAWTAEDVDDQGRLSLMLAPQSPDDLASLRRAIKQGHLGQVTGRLDLVHALVVKVDASAVARFIHTLPAGTHSQVGSTVFAPESLSLARFPSSRRSAPHGRPHPPPVPPPSGPIDVDRLVIGMDKVWAAGYTGQGQTGAAIDSGCYPHPDIKPNLKAFKDMGTGGTVPYDTDGHGTNGAGLMVGNGQASNGVVRGAAPDASLVAVRFTTVPEAIKGLEWVIQHKDEYGIGVVNISAGDRATVSYKNDLWAQACEKAIAAGLLVVVAAGNEGKGGPGSISSPGIDPYVITVGNMDSHKTTDARQFSMAGDTSAGPTLPDSLDKPDVVAPGENVYGPLAPHSKMDVSWVPHYLGQYAALHGSSQSTALVSGLLLCLKQAWPALTQVQAKAILEKTARPLPGVSRELQGHGCIDGWAALQAVLELKRQAEAPASG